MRQAHHTKGREATKDDGVDGAHETGRHSGLRHAQLIGAADKDGCHRRHAPHHLGRDARLQDRLSDDDVHRIGRAGKEQEDEREEEGRVEAESEGGSEDAREREANRANSEDGERTIERAPGVIQRRANNEIKRHHHRPDRASRTEHAEAKGANLQHVGEDREERYGAAKQDREQVHRKGTKHDALAQHEIDALTKADEDRLRGTCLERLGRAQGDGQAERGDETDRHRGVGYVLRMGETVLLAEPDHQAG